MKPLTFIIIFLNTLIVFSQTEKNETILIANNTWSKESLKMPLSFAPGIEYEGIEDIRFAEGWSKKDRPDFWTYVFVWHIKGIQKQTIENLEQHLKLYFDGLMLSANNDEEKIQGASVLFIENPNKPSSFIGKIKTYDRFHTKEVISLNCTVDAHYCETSNRSTIVFRLSLKPQKDKVWQKLQEVTVRDGICKN
ncbi:MAG: hypothetical protein ED556_03895 [Winogradskyella sp.]|uniref:hypothetical protein n=1 Tax=Winogradskyella sp. TaxID=1883156 RepID=UPI000F400C3F|nr:hypothetical protein [Winogradskyella sp.]RNC88336.1 MAG: hypothetical protein ED556_03895 [Winogradskyella sp.]